MGELVANPKAVSEEISKLNSKITTIGVGNDTITKIQSALVTLGNTMNQDEILPIVFTVSTAESSGPFRTSGVYIGTIKNHSSRLLISVQTSASAKVADIVTGLYINGVWKWKSLSDDITEINSKIPFSTITTGAINANNIKSVQLIRTENGSTNLPRQDYVEGILVSLILPISSSPVGIQYFMLDHDNTTYSRICWYNNWRSWVRLDNQ